MRCGLRGHQSSLIELLLNHLSGTVPSSCVGKCYPFPEKPSFRFRPQFISGENLSLLSSSSAAYYMELKFFFEALFRSFWLYQESLKQFSSGCSRWQRRAAFLAPTPLLLTPRPNESINPCCISTVSPVLLHFVLFPVTPATLHHLAPSPVTPRSHSFPCLHPLGGRGHSHPLHVVLMRWAKVEEGTLRRMDSCSILS